MNEIDTENDSRGDLGEEMGERRWGEERVWKKRILEEREYGRRGDRKRERVWKKRCESI